MTDNQEAFENLVIFWWYGPRHCGPLEWSTRSLDLTPLNCFVLGYVISKDSITKIWAGMTSGIPMIKKQKWDIMRYIENILKICWDYFFILSNISVF